MHWTEYFDERILERGFLYYLKDNVLSVEKSSGTISAAVAGTEKYFVKIDMADGEISSMSCTCPYAREGKYCKHMAAVLFTIDDYDAKLAEDYCKSKMYTDVMTLIEEADDVTIRGFLAFMLDNSMEMKYDFIRAMYQRLKDSGNKLS